MSLQQTVTDIGSGARDTVRGLIERQGNEVNVGSDELVLGAKELLGNVVHFLPSAVEFGGAVATAGTLGVAAAVPARVVGSIALRDELERNQEKRLSESHGRITAPLPAGSYSQNKTSQRDPAQLLHRNALSLADRVMPSDGKRLDSAVLPPDENQNRPVLVKQGSVPHPDQMVKIRTSTNQPQVTVPPGDNVPQDTGGATKIKSSPFN